MVLWLFKHQSKKLIKRPFKDTILRRRPVNEEICTWSGRCAWNRLDVLRSLPLPPGALSNYRCQKSFGGGLGSCWRTTTKDSWKIWTKHYILWHKAYPHFRSWVWPENSFRFVQWATWREKPLDTCVFIYFSAFSTKKSVHPSIHFEWGVLKAGATFAQSGWWSFLGCSQVAGGDQHRAGASIQVMESLL